MMLGRKQRNLVVDLSNVVHTTRHGRLKTPKSRRHKEKYAKEFIFKEALTSIMFNASKLKVDSIVITCEAKNVWRKDIYPEYKGNHDEDDIYKQETLDAMNELADFFRDYTSCLVLKTARCEGDDIIGRWCLTSKGVENIILSTDKDFIQLISEDTKLYNYQKKSRGFRESDDPEYDLFVKVIRGDAGDNIRSAYPRVRETRLQKAWENEYDMLQLLEEKTPDDKKVADLIDFNYELIDLSLQPDYIIDSIIDDIKNTPVSKYNDINVMQYFSQNNMKEFADMLEKYNRILKTKPVWRVNNV